MEREIQKLDNDLRKFKIKTNLFRFPGFRFGLNGILVCKKLNKKIIFGSAMYDWSAYDWLNPYLKKRADIKVEDRVKFVTKKVITKTKNGTIIILHDYLGGIGSNDAIIPILNKVIPLLKQNYKFVKVSQLINSS